ncbi:AMP-binding protein [Alteromonas gilva]|uniref:AMP-binding protein n=1 Tax=Alteromonas gilva TaxID=2987522 RepID=A0ABT5L0A9_9ALTE|nr:AMP-binding protein [Alteromonas gilva]MDC8830464.1 AMP-binding protein [Alteromonas gilva]
MSQTSPVLRIPFISEHRSSDALALLESQGSMTYRQLAAAVETRTRQFTQSLNVERPIILLVMDNNIGSVVDYLTALALDYVTLVVNPDASDEVRQAYIDAFNPHAVISQGQVSLRHTSVIDTDPRVSLLLSTSGSTGAGKCVALSGRNLVANCQSILEYLPILPSDNTLATLPLSYSYGLSVLNTHLQAGATVCFTRNSVFDKAFWTEVKTLPVHSLSGVPSFYDMLARLRFTHMDLPELRYFTQAGGRLKPALVEAFAHYAAEHNKQFFVMYGQTEATARMAYLAPHKAAAKPAAIGQAIAGGEFKIVASNQSTPGQGELFYRGDNVMLGYVSTVSELAGFTPPEWLATGDIASCDADGDYTLIGRLKRMIKLAGERVCLDVMEQLFTAVLCDYRLMLPACVIGRDDHIICLYSGDIAPDLHQSVLEAIAKRMQIPRRNITLRSDVTLPYTTNGKLDYAGLTAQLEEQN